MTGKTDIHGIICDIFRAKNETEHFQKDVELIFVIEGHIHVVVEGNAFLVEAEELLLINSNRLHYQYVDEEALICRFSISYDLLSNIFQEDYIAFWCNLITAKDPDYQIIREIIREIIMLKINHDKRDGFRLMEQYGKLLNCLTRNYRIQIAEGSHQTGRYNDSDRIQEVLNYINRNYQEPISLAGLADQMYVSVSTLSRIFRKATGVKFPDYVNQIRMHHAIEDLLNTNKSITEIAMDHGFSSPSSFNRVFREIYETTPSQYKKSVRNVRDSEQIELTKDDESQVRKYLDEHSVVDESVEDAPVVDIYPDSGKQYHPVSTQTVSLGAFYQLINSSVQHQIRQMAEQLHLQYIRMWNIFSPKMMIAVSPEEKQLSFEQVDVVLDFLVSIHIHPFLDMTDHPEVVIQNGRKIYFKREDSMGFQNIGQWSYFLEKLISHVVFRYGAEEVSQWIFEFGDYSVEQDTSYYFAGSAYYDGNLYRDVFETAYHIIKSHCPGAQVGGPDWVFDGKELDMAQHFDAWKEMNLYPDFYSVHIFPYVNQNPETFSNERNMDPDFLMNQMYEIHSRLKALNAPQRPLYVTETTTILSNRNAMNDHCFRGTNVLRVTNLFQGYADMVCFWVATDRLSLHYAPSGILHGGSGLMSKDGIPKPTYHALYFLSKLSNELLDKGKGYMAVRNAPDSIYILCYNHKNLIYDYKYEEENVVNVYNVDSMFEDNSPVTLRFMVHGLKAGGEYVVKHHIINQEYGSVMDEWRRLGFEPEMRGNDIVYMKNVCIPRIQMGRKVAEEGRIYLEAELLPHEMHLIHIYK